MDKSNFKLLDENGKISRDFNRLLESDLSTNDLQNVANRLISEMNKKYGASPNTALFNPNASATSKDASNSASKSGR